MDFDSPADSEDFDSYVESSRGERPSVRSRRRAQVIDTSIDASDWESVVQQIETWARRRESTYVCLCNVHSVVTARHDPHLRAALEGASLALPDGAPVALSLRLSGVDQQRRINGPDLMLRWLSHAQRNDLSVYFYGSTTETLKRLRHEIRRRFPLLRVVGMHSPPFRDLSEAEDRADVDRINRSGASVVFVGLGCPKQEVWMSRHQGRVASVMIGVGAAFDYHAGVVKCAPHWMQHGGLEWAHRLVSEPRRLMWRYLSTNSQFMLWLVRHASRSQMRRVLGRSET